MIRGIKLQYSYNCYELLLISSILAISQSEYSQSLLWKAFLEIVLLVGWKALCLNHNDRQGRLLILMLSKQSACDFSGRVRAKNNLTLQARSYKLQLKLVIGCKKPYC